MNSDFPFDYEQFEKVLYSTAEQAFTWLKNKHLGEDFFAFGLESHVEFEMMYPFLITNRNSDWATSVVPQWNNCRIPERDYDLDEMLTKFHRLISKGLRRYDNRILRAREENIPADQIEAMNKVSLNQYRQSCRNVLWELERSAVFGTGTKREETDIILVSRGMRT